MKKKEKSESPLTNFFKKMLPGRNRRRFKRVRVPFLLRYFIQETGLGSITNLHDLSVGGVLFTAEQPFLKGSEVKLEIVLPTSEQPVVASATVIRVTKVPNVQLYRIATKFNSLKPADRRAIRVLIERMARDSHAKGFVDRKKHVWVVHE